MPQTVLLAMDSPDAAYVHIPFCRRRCYYCDFPVSVIGDRGRGETSGTIAQYVDVLCQEILATPASGAPLQTVFFGGGTPSLLSVDQLERILATLQQRFGISQTAEISIEMDPGTFDLDLIQGYTRVGITRVSLGVQAFQAELLALCGRTHTPAEIATAVALIQEVGLTNYSLDLISGLPKLTLEHWQESLERAIALHPTHLSIYDLTIEPMTAFDRWYRAGEFPLPADEITAEMYRLAQRTLTAAGYDHYEISNYAQAGYQCRHNRVYWENRSYYGFGMGATSYTQGQRWARPRKRQAYFEWVRTLVDRGAIDCPVTPIEEQLLDTLMVGFRLAEGISLTKLVQQFGEIKVQQILQCLDPYHAKGWIDWLPERATCSSTSELRVRLTDPEGFLFSNVVLAKLFEELG